MDAVQKNRARIGLVGLVVVAVAGGVYMWKVAQPVHAEIRGKILSMDVATRTGQIEYVHPKNGNVYELTGTVATDCKILIDGKPGSLDAFKPGDKIDAKGLVYRTGKIIAQELCLVRDATSAASDAAPAQSSQPATP